MEIILPSLEDIVYTNRKIGGNVLNLSNIHFLLSKIELEKKKQKNRKRIIGKIAANLWIGITKGHSFVDGNKRTATETVKFFLEKNGFNLNFSTAGLVYVSLKIANDEMNLKELEKLIISKCKNLQVKRAL